MLFGEYLLRSDNEYEGTNPVLVMQVIETCIEAYNDLFKVGHHAKTQINLGCLMPPLSQGKKTGLGSEKTPEMLFSTANQRAFVCGNADGRS